MLVLAGGESRRMGRPKAWIEAGDTVLLRYIVERLAPSFSEVMVSFAEPEQMEQHLPYRVVFDRKRSAIVSASGFRFGPALRPKKISVAASVQI